MDEVSSFRVILSNGRPCPWKIVISVWILFWGLLFGGEIVLFDRYIPTLAKSWSFAPVIIVSLLIFGFVSNFLATSLIAVVDRIFSKD